MMIKYLAWILICLSFCCQTNQNEIEAGEQIYFPLQEFVENLSAKLNNKGLRKSMQVGGESFDVKEFLSPDQWQSELDIFIQADINKPSLRGSYQTDKTESSLTHTLKPGEKGKVKKLTVHYEGKNVKEISFLSATDNTFYSSETHGTLTLNELGLLDHFSIKGTQKVVALSPNVMIVDAEVISN
jgi:hypothetical protein